MSEVRHLHANFTIGTGATSCQPVEALGHQINVVATHSGWDKETFLGKVFGMLDMRFGAEHHIMERFEGSFVRL